MADADAPARSTVDRLGRHVGGVEAKPFNDDMPDWDSDDFVRAHHGAHRETVRSKGRRGFNRSSQHFNSTMAEFSHEEDAPPAYGKRLKSHRKSSGCQMKYLV
jgi:hypothetical protein